MDFIFKKIITLDSLSEESNFKIEYIEDDYADDYYESTCYKISLGDEFLIAASDDFCGKYLFDKYAEIKFFRSKGSGLSIIKGIALIYQSVFITNEDEESIKKEIDDIYIRVQQKTCSQYGLMVDENENVTIK